jgi:3-oxoacyl-[acyl-carrier protein] reductase
MLGLGLEGRRAIVTGGSRGVGAATARLLARAGAHVGVSYHSRGGEAEAVVAALRQLGVKGWAEAVEIADPGAVDRLFERAGAEMGGVDIVVANAGIWPVEDVPIARMTGEQWHRTVAINLDGVFHTVRAAARVLAEGGRIVVVGSTAGQRGEANHADYAATKGALISLVKGVAVELAARDITVNCVAPGWIDTDMAAIPYAEGGRARIEATIPLGRVATADDIAGPIVFLCSPYARHITGEVLNVNGGAVLCG